MRATGQKLAQDLSSAMRVQFSRSPIGKVFNSVFKRAGLSAGNFFINEAAKNITAGLVGLTGRSLTQFGKWGRANGGLFGSSMLSEVSVWTGRTISFLNSKWIRAGGIIGSGFARSFQGAMSSLPQLLGAVGASMMGGLVSLIPALVTGISSLVGAVGSLASALVPGLVGALVGAGGAVEGLVSIVGVGMLAFRGVGTALKDMSAAQQKSAVDAMQNARAQRAASQQVVSAQRNLSIAQREQAQVAVRSNQQIVQAQRSLVSAQEQLKQSYQDLHDARLQAKRDLEDLKEKVSDDALAVEGAQIALIRAQQNYDQVMQSATSTTLDRRQAALDLAEAEDAVGDAQKQQKDDQNSLVDAQKKGINHADSVVAAQKNVASATQAVSDAQANLKQTQQDAAEQQQAATERVQEAQDNLTNALQNQTDVMKQSTSTQQKMAQSLAALSPPAQQFVKWLFAQRGVLKDLQATAAKGLFPGMEAGLKGLMSLLPSISSTVGSIGGSIGGFFSRLGTALGGPLSKEFQNILAVDAQSVDHLGRMFIGDGDKGLLPAIMKFWDSASTNFFGPFMNTLDRVFGGFNDWVDKLSKNGGLTSWFQMANESIGSMLSLTGQLGGALANIFKAGFPAGQELLTSLTGALKSFNDWASSAKGQSSIADFFNSGVPVVKALGSLVVDLAKGFSAIQKAMGPKTASLFAQVGTQLVPAITTLLIKLGQGDTMSKFVDLLTNMVNLFSELIDTGLLGSLISAVNFLVNGLKNLAGLPGADHLLRWLGLLAGGFLAVHGALRILGPLLAIPARLVGLFFGKKLVGGALSKIADHAGVLKPLLKDISAILKDGPMKALLGGSLGKVGTKLAGMLGGTKDKATGLLTGAIDQLRIAIGRLAAAIETHMGGVGGGGGFFGGAGGGAAKTAEKEAETAAKSGGRISTIFGRVFGAAGLGGLFKKIPGVEKLIAKVSGSKIGSMFGKIFGSGSGTGGVSGFLKSPKMAKIGGAAGIGLALGGGLLGSLVSGGQTSGVRGSIGGALSGAGIGASFGMLLGPEGALAGAGIGAIIGLVSNNKTLKKFFTKDLPGWTSDSWKTVKQWFAGPFVDFFTKSIPNAFNKVKSFLVRWGPEILTVVMPVLGIPLLIHQHWGDIVNFFKGLPGEISSGLKDLGGIIAEPFKEGYDWIKGHGQEAIGFLTGLFSRLPGALGSFANNAWTTVRGAFEHGINVITQNVINKWFIDPINNYLLKWLPGGLKIPDIPRIGSAVHNAPGSGQSSGTATGSTRALAAGGTIADPVPVRPMAVNRPVAIVGEGDPRWPEYVIPTDPRYRRRARALLGAVSAQMMKDGGVVGALEGLGKGALGGITGLVGAGADILRHGLAWIIGNTLKPILNKVTGMLPDNIPGRGARSGITSAADWLQKKIAGDKTTADKMISEAAPGGGGAVARWATVVQQALKMLSLPSTLTLGVLSIIGHESGGNPRAINLTDSNAIAGHPSQGLMQTIPGTFEAWRSKALPDNILDPLANIYAGVNYALHRYGVGMIAAGGRWDSNGNYQGYRSGGIIGRLLADNGGLLGPGMSLVRNATGHPEVIMNRQQIPEIINQWLGGRSGGASLLAEIRAMRETLEGVDQIGGFRIDHFESNTKEGERAGRQAAHDLRMMAYEKGF